MGRNKTTSKVVPDEMDTQQTLRVRVEKFDHKIYVAVWEQRGNRVQTQPDFVGSLNQIEFRNDFRAPEFASEL